MTQQEKQLLLIDLSARLLYGVKFKVDNTIPPMPSDEDYRLGNVHYVLTATALDIENDCICAKETGMDCVLKKLTPYLRPMSSMTERELKEYKCLNDALDENYEVHIDNAFPAFDWLNAHHFDYRGLIEKGLALEAPEGMYK